jgi:hypothetical protein
VADSPTGAYVPPLPADGGFCHWDTYDNANGEYWADCECGFESARYPNRVSAMRDADMHAPYPCASCGVWRRRWDMQSAVDMFWRNIPGKFICRDAGACFEAVKLAAYAAGDARRATTTSCD